MKYISRDGNLLYVEDNYRPPGNNLVFETILVQNSYVTLKELHWERLFSGLRHLNKALPGQCNAQWLERQVLETARANNAALCRARVWVYDREPYAGIIIECFPVGPEALRYNERGWHLGISETIVKAPGTMSNIKRWDARLYEGGEIIQRGLDDILIRNTSGNIIESSIANVYIVNEGTIYTPPLADGCVAGVMRRYIIDTLAEQGIKIIEQSITESDLREADELFLSNAIRRIKWVAKLGNKQYDNTYSRQLSELLFGV